ncbi:hypothetical protein P3W85_22270 [Cupriavidus basilensis]|uniref:Uncharacterized protein n=1 Tax=Cupriavidus basilensis TaxID=68895 RepID=A0ABT6ASP4_9BURK|nr:hypothetical protein [Cupriavidus basilensis]MDF3835654.1 hypothetical protein [Cupriavidus basilensis]
MSKRAAISIKRMVAAHNPIRWAPIPQRRAKRSPALSLAFHRYLAEKRTAKELGWLGGPWALTYTQVGVTDNGLFIETNGSHEHHVHISVGTEQP